MREYARVSPKFWVGATGKQIRQLGPECQVVALYLLTSPHANMIGLYYLPVTFIAHETGLTVTRAETVLAKLVGAGFCSYDTDAEVVWVYEMARYQLGEIGINHKQARGAASLYDSAPDCTHLAEFFVRYQSLIPLEKQRGTTGRKPIDSLSIPHPLPIDVARKPIDLERRARSDEQEQRSDEQGDERKTTALSGRPDDAPDPNQPDPETEHERPPAQSREILAVFAHYRTHHPRAHPKPTSGGKEWRAIKARLAEGYAADELMQAIDGCHKTPWNCGENPGGKKYQDLELIMRSGDHVARFAEQALLHANGPPQVLSEQTRRNLRAADAWVQSHERKLEEKNAGS